MTANSEVIDLTMDDDGGSEQEGGEHESESESELETDDIKIEIDLDVHKCRLYHKFIDTVVVDGDEGDETVFLQSFRLKKEYRGCNHGRMVLSHLFDFWRDSGTKYMVVRWTPPIGLWFLKKHGFRKTDAQEWVKDLLDDEIDQGNADKNDGRMKGRSCEDEDRDTVNLYVMDSSEYEDEEDEDEEEEEESSARVLASFRGRENDEEGRDAFKAFVAAASEPVVFAEVVEDIVSEECKSITAEALDAFLGLESSSEVWARNAEEFFAIVGGPE